MMILTCLKINLADGDLHFTIKQELFSVPLPDILSKILINHYSPSGKNIKGSDITKDLGDR
ncbi:hypothetical protein Anas_11133 [Armadillidium nasatum]|uniref:Uncharacterized protein n=1 Tax=Armadillidium nasatum TaxID=96803 RepID=A0A5N5TM85_9CRUS|nr:hypothetical protein Anas_11133 [Armadillidium nasatum]